MVALRDEEEYSEKEMNENEELTNDILTWDVNASRKDQRCDELCKAKENDRKEDCMFNNNHFKRRKYKTNNIDEQIKVLLEKLERKKWNKELQNERRRRKRVFCKEQSK